MELLGTLLTRWYAFAFVGAFLWSALAERSLARALRFLGVAALVSFVAELSSTRTGFPYGFYHYSGRTAGDEAFIAGIPLFVPLTFGVVVWAGRSLAIVGFGARSQAAIVTVGAVIATTIDVVMDPVTLRGERWFLGDLYSYGRPFEPAEGPALFGVPLSNYAGWLLVSAVIILIDDLLDRRFGLVVHPLRGPTLAAAVCSFFIVIALAIGEIAIALTGLAVSVVLFGAAWPRIKRAALAASS